MPALGAPSTTAWARARSANFLWWPYSSPSDAASTSRRPATDERAAEASTAATNDSLLRVAVPNASSRDSGPSNTATASERPEPSPWTKR